MSVEERPGGMVVRVVGVVDGLTLPEVSRVLTDAQREGRTVFVDLEQVSFMDSRGLGSLLAANERSREGAAPIRIYRPSEPVRRLLTVSGVGAVLTLAEELPPA
ncbi:MAG: STAS domain-containing protein [Thermoleophilia bacterium]|nr:STAS domain-containing protein [Thermoleophilia bacterium]